MSPPENAKQPLTMRPIKRGPRMVVHETLQHQNPGGSPTSVVRKFLRRLSSDEQPFTRRFTVTQATTALETGWLDRTSMLLLANDGGPDSAAVTVGMISSLGVIGFARIRPGESLRLEPYDLAAIRVRSDGEPVKCVLHLLPE